MRRKDRTGEKGQKKGEGSEVIRDGTKGRNKGEEEGIGKTGREVRGGRTKRASVGEGEK